MRSTRLLTLSPGSTSTGFESFFVMTTLFQPGTTAGEAE